eukprot:7386654-Prymnesium_polylepis.1
MALVERRRLCAWFGRHRGHARHAVHARHLLQGWVLHCRVPAPAPHAPRAVREGGALRPESARRAQARRALRAHGLVEGLVVVLVLFGQRGNRLVLEHLRK